jgi:quercetin dioxygenase-like cupin family protein
MVETATDADRWTWPDELDALSAAPQNHRVLLENERVRVLQTHIPVGATTPVHTHRWPSIEYVQSGSHLVRRDGNGNVKLDSRVAGAPLRASEVTWAEPFPPHSAENVGEVEIRVLMIELKANTNGYIGHS